MSNFLFFPRYILTHGNMLKGKLKKKKTLFSRQLLKKLRKKRKKLGQEFFHIWDGQFFFKMSDKNIFT